MGRRMEESIDSVELTPRAVAVGCGIGALLVTGNVYMGLKTGWWESGNITAVLLGFGILAPLARWRGRPYSPLENNLTQATATAAAGMAATLGLLSTIPAFDMVGARAPAWLLVPWGASLAVLGIAFALLLRRRMLEREQLPFPTGVVVAELITTIHARGAAVGQRMRALGVSAGIAAVATWLRDGPSHWIPGATLWPGTIAGSPASAFTLGIAWSPMLFGVGALIGLRAGLSLLLGALLAWLVAAPALVGGGIVAEASFDPIVRWLVWPGTALLLASAITSMIQGRVHLRAR